ncbi:MAG: thioredoxin-disulfide reductase [Alphaproteobacteria bacterium]|nr:thioredoxin-disulfide reductase [Alphaproteobacteria bacterium]MBU1513456.1 thioredoxin-disulfide reductase [Alphaproteobacteria bacterium]MBU2096448.1 thioredoxin-disulfide reductase [Alphaproteobacteria bacterium]MBU2149860.1 thioredoxin-disulfide reductase [Alphaproteobacteria bacterium]MBU2308234.1 thioredoxin-disulfide reductase [Alphaproteobacteria bacterium]
MFEPRSVRCLIVGSGPAGYTAAIYAARALLNPVLIQGIQPGGQLTITTDVENYPGFADVIQGPWLMEQMQAQAAHVGTEIVSDIVLKADLSQRPFRLETDSGQVWLAETLIIATGAQAKWLGLETESKFQGFGVSACATCDGFFYRGKNVIVVGGGNTAVEEALFLTNFAAKVTIVHRKDEFRAEKILQERLFSHPKIEVIWEHVLDEVTGDTDPLGVTGVKLKNVKTGEARTVDADGVFIAIGHAPASELFKGQLEMDASGYLKVKAGTAATAIEGVYAAGDVTDDIYRQAVTAAGMGCMAALEAVRFLAEEDHKAAHHPITHHEAQKIGVW